MAIRLSVSIQRYTIYIVLMSLIALPGAWGQERGMYEGSGKVVVTAYAPYWSLSGRDIVPSSLRLRALAEDRGRQLGALYLGEVHAALLEHATLLHHPGAAAAALGSLPALLLETAQAAIELLQTGADGILQTHQQSPGPRP